MNATTIDDKAFNAMLDAARKFGERVGRNAAEWAIQDLWGGRQTRHASAVATARAVVDDVTEEAILNGWSAPNLSGELAGDPTPADVASECGLEREDDDGIEVDGYDDMLSDLCDAWESAAWDGMLAELERSAAEFLASEEDR